MNLNLLDEYLIDVNTMEPTKTKVKRMQDKMVNNIYKWCISIMVGSFLAFTLWTIFFEAVEKLRLYK